MIATQYIFQNLTNYVNRPDQWQPTLTHHDPNPPILLLNPTPTGYLFFMAS